jgi:HEAT repeats
MKKYLASLAILFGGLMSAQGPALLAPEPQEPAPPAQPAPAAAPAPAPMALQMEERMKARIDGARVKALTLSGEKSFRWQSGDDETYRRAGRLVDEHQYERALEGYQQVIESKGSRVEGALYWKAYALGKLGHGAEASAALEELKKSYSSSRWLNDARALELEIRQGAGQKASPEAENDEDLKLLALNGLIGTDPDRVIPQVERILTSAKSSPKLKERALFVLAQSRNAKAREMLTKYARGGTNPDLQLKAVEYLGAHGAKEDRAVLSEIYQANSDLGIRRAILQSYVGSHDADTLLQLARSEQNETLRAEAIRYASIAGADVWPLYAGGSGAIESRRALAQALFTKGDSAHLAEIIRTDKEPKVRRDAIRYLGNLPRAKSADLLIAIYGAESDKEVRAEILNAFQSQQNAKALIDVARKEPDPGLKREAVRRLTTMHSPEANEYLMELLNK